MPQILRKNYILALLTLLALAGYATLFETGGSAAEPRQASAPASSSSNLSRNLNSLSPGINQSDDDVQIVLTTYKDGQVFSQVIGHATNASQTTSGNSSAASLPLRPAAAGDLVISQVYGSGGNPGSTYQNNFIEFFNRTDSDINFNGWRIYIAVSSIKKLDEIVLIGGAGISTTAVDLANHKISSSCRSERR